MLPQPGQTIDSGCLDFHSGGISRIKGIRFGFFSPYPSLKNEVHSAGCHNAKTDSVALAEEWKEVMKQLLIWFIRGYQKFISPLKPPCCRFYPTCSSYAIQVLRRFGAFRGSYLALRRIFRCNPFHPGGFDYPPDKFSFFYRKFRSDVTTPRELPDSKEHS